MIASMEKNPAKIKVQLHKNELFSQIVSFSKDWKLELRVTKAVRPAEAKVFADAGFAITCMGKQRSFYLNKAPISAQVSPTVAETET